MKISELKQILYYIDELKKISKSLDRLNLISCNYGLTEKQQKRLNNLITKAKELSNNLGYDIYYQGDPRGCALWLIEKEQKNSYLFGIPL